YGKNLDQKAKFIPSVSLTKTFITNMLTILLNTQEYGNTNNKLH
ncbi:mCG1042090, partial [Mus musculus]